MVNETIKINLEDLGYNDFFKSARKSLGFVEYPAARVIAEHKESYRVKGKNGEFLAKITGKHVFNASKREDYPAVGDWVIIIEIEKRRAVIHDILPRKTILKKKYSDKQDAQVVATNIDTALVVESLDRDYNLNRFERYFVLAIEGGIEPVVILNKIDLITETELNAKIYQIKRRFCNIDIIPTSAVTGRGLNELENYIKKGKTYCFLGSSGVGKSSLINKLIKRDEIKTSKISTYTGRGKHTTTARGIYFLESGGIVIDNPGIREVGVTDANVGIENVFNDLVSLSKNCRYADCTHTHEPGCAVKKALKDKKLDEKKYQNYIKLKKEAEYYQMTGLEKRKKDRKFGQFVKKAQDQLKKFKP
jgi:ribosome biogenesis GTPase